VGASRGGSTRWFFRNQLLETSPHDRKPFYPPGTRSGILRIDNPPHKQAEIAGRPEPGGHSASLLTEDGDSGGYSVMTRTAQAPVGDALSRGQSRERPRRRLSQERGLRSNLSNRAECPLCFSGRPLDRLTPCRNGSAAGNARRALGRERPGLEAAAQDSAPRPAPSVPTCEWR
jgi:hypothetical protein